MRWSIFAGAALLLAEATSARDMRAQNLQSRNSNFVEPGQLAGPAAPAMNFHRITPEEAVSSLSAKAQATPSAVKLLPDVPLSIGANGLVHNLLPTGAPLRTRNVAESRAETLEPSRVERQVAKARSGTCTNPTTVYEWGNATAAEQSSFTEAIKCLFSKPARSGLPGTQTRWDDLSAIHQIMNTEIHMVGQFLPWHRYFLYIFEQELRNTCGMTSPMLWWDETLNAGNFNGGAPFTGTDEFGHMPNGNVVCIISGVFNNTNLHIGPGSSDTTHCLSRGVNETLAASVTNSFVNTCNSYTDFNDMQQCSDYGPHAYGHDAIGGVMSDVQTSPGDPVFFMHHGFINRNWRNWQIADAATRTNAIGGWTTQSCEASSGGSGCVETSLDYELSSLGFYPNVTISEVMNPTGGFLCYHYDY